jgi:hypothetical protein
MEILAVAERGGQGEADSPNSTLRAAESGPCAVALQEQRHRYELPSFFANDHRRALHGPRCAEDAGARHRARIPRTHLDSLSIHPPPIHGGLFIFHLSVGLKFAVCNHACVRGSMINAMRGRPREAREGIADGGSIVSVVQDGTNDNFPAGIVQQ